MEPLPFSDSEVAAAFADYRVSAAPLGEGNFKVAYRGEVESLGVVLKVIKEPVSGEDEESDDDLPERFSRELLAMETVACPHVVTILEPPSIRQVGAHRHLWYVEPYYPGPTLKQDIESGRTGAPLARQVLLQMLRAVKALWESPSRIVHRDIKPGNIIHNGEDLVLLDLGIAFHADLSALTESLQSSPKTARYAAPEQFLARRYATIDFRTDLFQIGIVAYEAATGRHPFYQPGIRPDEYQRRMANFAAAQLDGSGLPTELVHMITRLLAERPAGRYRDVDKALAILEGKR